MTKMNDDAVIGSRADLEQTDTRADEKNGPDAALHHEALDADLRTRDVWLHRQWGRHGAWMLAQTDATDDTVGKNRPSLSAIAIET